MSNTTTIEVTRTSEAQCNLGQNTNEYAKDRQQEDLGKVECIKIADYVAKADGICNDVAFLSAVFQESLIVVKDKSIFIYRMTIGIRNEMEKILEREQKICADFVIKGISRNETFIVYRNAEKDLCIRFLKEFSTMLKNVETIEKATSLITVRSEDIFRYRLQVLYDKSLSEDETQLRNYEPEVVSLNHAKRMAQADLTKVVLPRLEKVNRIHLSDTKHFRIYDHYPVLETDFRYTNELVCHSETLPSPANFHTAPGEQDMNRLEETSHQIHSQARYPSYATYDNRLMTYPKTWDKKPSVKLFSEAGFFYTREGEVFRCFQCGLGLKDFSEHDDPFLEHVRYSGQCPFLPEMLGDARFSAMKEKLQTCDPEYNRSVQRRDLHIKTVYRYRHPDYESEEARVESYHRWPLKEQFSHQLLAQTGLFYTGYETVVRCFACDGGFRKLALADDLWLQHAFYFPSCPYVRIKKGDHFIKIVKTTKTQIEEEEEKKSVQGAAGGVPQSGANMRDIKIENRMYLKNMCLEMGYLEPDIDDALLEMRKRGYRQTIDTLIDLIEDIKERRKLRDKVEHLLNESRMEQNDRLRRIANCMLCGQRVNALFLPCTHHQFCMDCAKQIEKCPICKKNIAEKIQTFMV